MLYDELRLTLSNGLRVPVRGRTVGLDLALPKSRWVFGRFHHDGAPKAVPPVGVVHPKRVTGIAFGHLRLWWHAPSVSC